MWTWLIPLLDVDSLVNLLRRLLPRTYCLSTHVARIFRIVWSSCDAIAKCFYLIVDLKRCALVDICNVQMYFALIVWNVIYCRLIWENRRSSEFTSAWSFLLRWLLYDVLIWVKALDLILQVVDIRLHLFDLLLVFWFLDIVKEIFVVLFPCLNLINWNSLRHLTSLDVCFSCYMTIRDFEFHWLCESDIDTVVNLAV